MASQQPPLRSKGRDQRLHGGHAGIQYHIEAAAVPDAASDNSNSTETGAASAAARESAASSPEVIVSPRSIDSRGEIIQTASSSQRQRTRPPPAGASAVARMPQPEKISTLSPNMRNLMESKFGQKAVATNPHAHPAEKLRKHTNYVIKHRATFIKAALEINRPLSHRVENAIPKKQLAEKVKRGAVIEAMLKIYRVLYECLQYSTFDLGRKVDDETSVFFDIMESNAQDCRLDKERESDKHINERFGKSYKLSAQNRNRGYLKDGGKKLSRSDGYGTLVKCCPKCTLDLFDKEPEFDENKRHNARAKVEWEQLKTEVDDYLSGTIDEAPIDPKTNKTITSADQVKNYATKPLLLHCQIGKNNESRHYGGSKCHFGCKVKGKKYPKGTCPACKKTCSFVWDMRYHKEYMEYWDLERLRKETTPGQRNESNAYLDRVSGLGRMMYDNAHETMQEMRDEEVLQATEEEIADAAIDQTYNGMQGGQKPDF